MNLACETARNEIATAVWRSDARLLLFKRPVRRVVDALIPVLPSKEAILHEGKTECAERLNEELRAIFVVGFFMAFFYQLAIGIAVTICLRWIFRNDKAQVIQRARA